MEVFHYEGRNMNGGFVGLRSSISSSVQPPSLQETQSHCRKKLSGNVDFKCWSDKTDKVVFIVFISISLRVTSQLLTIFIHWAI